MKRKSVQLQYGEGQKTSRPTKPINISLILANIEDMNADSLIELQYALKIMNNRYGFSPSIILLTETRECKLSRTQPELKGYKYLGKPIDKLPQATRGRGNGSMGKNHNSQPMLSGNPIENEPEHTMDPNDGRPTLQ